MSRSPDLPEQASSTTPRSSRPATHPLEQAVAEHVRPPRRGVRRPGRRVRGQRREGRGPRRVVPCRERALAGQRRWPSISSSPAAPARSSRRSPGSRRSEGLSLRAVEFALRDEEDLAHNAQRLVQVVDSLGEALDDVTVFAEPPVPAGHPVARLAGRPRRARGREIHLKFRTGGVTRGPVPRRRPRWPRASRRRWTASCRSSAPPGCTTRCGTATRRPGSSTTASSTCCSPRAPRSTAAVPTRWRGCSTRPTARPLAAARLGDPDEAARTRRWFTSFGSCSVLEAHEDLVELGLIDAHELGRGRGWVGVRPGQPAVRRLLGRRRPAAGRRTHRRLVLDASAAARSAATRATAGPRDGWRSRR